MVRRMKLVVAVATVMALMAVGALPAAAQSSGPICQLFLTNGELGYFPNGGDGYYDNVYGWHMWCQSPVWGWYVQR
ncbi:MAG: hypothetical protein H0T57_17655 [Rubrobacter sp.]|nr:hypothetical protein [Rubrobacter sp.]